MNFLIKSKRTVWFITILSIVMFAVSPLSSFALNPIYTFQISDGQTVFLNQQETDELITITAEEAADIALLFVRDVSSSENIIWDNTTKIENIIPMFDNTNSDTINAYTIELTDGYVVVSAYLDTESLIPEWSDRGEPLYSSFERESNDKIIYLGGYEYFLDIGESTVTDLYSDSINRNELIDFINQW